MTENYWSRKSILVFPDVLGKIGGKRWSKKKKKEWDGDDEGKNGRRESRWLFGAFSVVVVSSSSSEKERSRIKRRATKKPEGNSKDTAR